MLKRTGPWLWRGLVAEYNLTAAASPVTGARGSGANLLLHSEDLTQAAWAVVGTCTRTLAAGEAPDGTNTAIRLQFGANSDIHQDVSATQAVPTARSIWIKGVQGETITVRIAASDQIVALNGSWQQITGSLTALRIYVGTWGGATARDVLVWHPQLNEGALVSYVATTAKTSVPNGVGGTAMALTSVTQRGAGGVFGAASLVTLQAKPTVWTVANLSPTVCDAVDSAGGKYRAGVANGAAAEFNLTAAGGYNGNTLAGYLLYGRILTAKEHLYLYRVLQAAGLTA